MTSERAKEPMGLWMSLSLVIGTMIGAGIFFLPSSLAPLGWNAVLGWIISGSGAICLAISFRYLMDGTGAGIQHNVERVLGEIPAFLGIWAYWWSGPVSTAALTIAGGTILAEFLFDDPEPHIGIIIALVVTWLLVLVNLSGTQSAGRLQVLSVLIKLVPLVLVIAVFAWVAAGPAPLQELAPTPFSLSNISSAVALTLFALLGFEMASVPVNKIRNPDRNIPLALIGGTMFVLIIYLLASTGTMMVMPWQEIASSSAPFSDVLNSAMGSVAGTIMAVCIFVSVTGCANGLVLVGAECTLSMAQRREVPLALGHINARGVPDIGVITTGIATTVLLLANMSRGLSGLFTFMVLLTTGTALVFYFVAAIAAAKENTKTARWPVLILGIVFAAFATYGTGLESSAWVLVLLAAGLVMRWFCKRAAARDAFASAA